MGKHDPTIVTPERHARMRDSIESAGPGDDLRALDPAEDTLDVLMRLLIPRETLHARATKTLTTEEKRAMLHRWNDSRILGSDFVDAIAEACDAPK
jgi:hypothetical protein